MTLISHYESIRAKKHGKGNEEDKWHCVAAIRVRPPQLAPSIDCAAACSPCESWELRTTTGWIVEGVTWHMDRSDWDHAVLWPSVYRAIPLLSILSLSRDGQDVLSDISTSLTWDKEDQWCPGYINDPKSTPCLSHLLKLCFCILIFCIRWHREKGQLTKPYQKKKYLLAKV